MTQNSQNAVISKLAADYLHVTNSGFYLSNQAVLRALDQRIVELFERLKENDTPNRVKRLIDCWNHLDAVAYLRMIIIESGDKEAIKAYNVMQNEVTRAYHDYESWNQIFSAFDLRRKTSADEIKIWKDAKAMMTAKDGVELAAQLYAANVEVLSGHPDGQRLIRELRYRFANIIGEADLGNVERGGEEIIDIDAKPVDREPLLHTGNPERPETEGEDAVDGLPEGHAQ